MDCDPNDTIYNYKFWDKLINLDFIEKIMLYGSRARKDHTDRADIDIAIDCPQASDENWLRVLDIIENADTLLKIDCIRYDSLQPNSPLLQSINRDSIIIYQR